MGFVSLGSFIGGFFGVGGSFLFSAPAFVSLPDINCFLRLDQRPLSSIVFPVSAISLKLSTQRGLQDPIHPNWQSISFFDWCPRRVQI